MAEKLKVVVIADGEELKFIDMGEPHQSTFYKEEVTFYRSGWVMEKGEKQARYNYSISLTRRKEGGESG